MTPEFSTDVGERLRLIRIDRGLSLAETVRFLREKEGIGSKAHLWNIEKGNEGVNLGYLNAFERSFGIEPNTTLYDSCNFLTREGIGEPVTVLRSWNITPGYNRWVGYNLSGEELDCFIFEKAARVSKAWNEISYPTLEAYQEVSKVLGNISVNVIKRAQQLTLLGQTIAEGVLDYYSLRQTLTVIRRLQRQYPEADLILFNNILQEGIWIGRKVLSSLDGRIQAKTLAPLVQTRIFQRGRRLILNSK